MSGRKQLGFQNKKKLGILYINNIRQKSYCLTKATIHLILLAFSLHGLTLFNPVFI